MWFTFRYDKLRNGQNKIIKTAKLLEALPVDLKDLSPEFLAYDTENKFPVPDSGRYIMLVFQKPPEPGSQAKNLFTTLRKCPPGKGEVFRKMIGQEIPINFIDLMAFEK